MKNIILLLFIVPFIGCAPSRPVGEFSRHVEKVEFYNQFTPSNLADFHVYFKQNMDVIEYQIFVMSKKTVYYRTPVSQISDPEKIFISVQIPRTPRYKIVVVTYGKTTQFLKISPKRTYKIDYAL